MFNSDNTQWLIGYLLSAVGHLGLGALCLLYLEYGSHSAIKPAEVFSVTLEGGTKLGGASQVAKKEGQKKVLTDPKLKNAEAEKTAEKQKEQAKKAKEIELKQAAILEEKKKKEQAKKKEAEKKKAEKKKKKVAELKKKVALEKKKKEDAAKKKAEEERKKKIEDRRKKQEAAKKRKEEKAARDRRLKEAVQRHKDLYSGESSKAGGQGFGAARTGGKGFGGGTLRSAEFIAYLNALEHHIKSSWNWGLPTPRVLKAQVTVSILPNGVVQNAKISASSGNSQFDDSIIRAVRKSCLLYTSPSPRDRTRSRMPSSA